MPISKRASRKPPPVGCPLGSKPGTTLGKIVTRKAQINNDVMIFILEICTTEKHLSLLHSLSSGTGV
jgi:hypothetical protein